MKELGVVKAIRFIGQFDMGSGDYATDRDEWQKELTVEGIVADIERRRRSERKRKRTIPSAQKAIEESPSLSTSGGKYGFSSLLRPMRTSELQRLCLELTTLR